MISSERRLSDLVHPDDVARHAVTGERAAPASRHSSVRGEWRLSDHEGRWHFTETVVANLLEDPHVQRPRVHVARHRRAHPLPERAPAPGVPRRSHRTREPRAVQGPRRACAGGAPSGPAQCRRALHGHRRLQARQRQLRPRAGRQSAGPGRRAARRHPARQRHRRTTRRRRVRHPPRGSDDLREACRVAERSSASSTSNFSLEADAPPVSVEHRGRRVGRIAHVGRGAAARRRRRDVLGQGARQEPPRGLRARDAGGGLSRRLELANELRRAVERREFVVFYQPIVEISTQRIVGHRGPRALGPSAARASSSRAGSSRWRRRRDSSSRSATSCSTQACRQLAAGRSDLEAPSLRMAVNLSPRQLKDPELVAKVRRGLASTEVEPRLLTLEITETALVEESHATLARLQGAQGAGRAAVDRRLRHRVLVAELPASVPGGRREDRQAVRRPHRRGRRTTPRSRGPSSPSARRCELEVVAEGIEQESQMRELRRLGCKLGQGYFTSRPLPPSGWSALDGTPRS